MGGTHNRSLKFWLSQHPLSHITVIWVLGNRLALTMFAISSDQMIAIYDLPWWLPHWLVGHLHTFPHLAAVTDLPASLLVSYLDLCSSLINSNGSVFLTYPHCCTLWLCDLAMEIPVPTNSTTYITHADNYFANFGAAALYSRTHLNINLESNQWTSNVDFNPMDRQKVSAHPPSGQIVIFCTEWR